MIEKINDYDFLIASRHVVGSTIVGWGLGRKITHSTAGAIAKIILKLVKQDYIKPYYLKIYRV